MTPFHTDQPNRNALWSALLVEELVRQGIEHFAVAPGSRSAPLVVAAVRNARARVHVHHDERAAAFFALGLARGSGRPAAVITTSGSAVANLLPAAVEASLDQVPLLLLTADRPPELRACGANQSIPQNGLLDAALRWRFELPCPGGEVAARVVLTTAAHVAGRAALLAGPVQLNCPLREPLAPASEHWEAAELAGTERWAEGQQPFTRLAAAPAVAGADTVVRVAAALQRGTSGWLLVGSLPLGTDTAPIRALAAALGWPVFADVRSGLRLGGGIAELAVHADTLLANGRITTPDVVLQLGGQLVAKHVPGAFDPSRLQAHVVVDRSLRRLDPNHAVTEHVCAEPPAFCTALARSLAPRRPTADGGALRALDDRIAQALANRLESDFELTEPWVARWLSRHMDADHLLFASSSLPIRHLQRYAATDGPAVPVVANRGASGIDGVLATAAGVAIGSARPTTLLIGDQALLHDLGSLALLATARPALAVVVLNNGGGSIFSTLPIARHAELMSPYFDAAHDFEFAGAAATFGLTHRAVANTTDFAEAYRELAGRGAPGLIEVRSSLAANRNELERLEALALDAIAEP